MTIFLKHVHKWTPDTKRSTNPGMTVMVKNAKGVLLEAPHGQGRLVRIDCEVHYHYKGRFDHGRLVSGKVVKKTAMGNTMGIYKGTFYDDYVPPMLHGSKCEMTNYDGDRAYVERKGVYKGVFHMGTPISVDHTNEDGDTRRIDDSMLTWEEAVYLWGLPVAKKVLRDCDPESELARTAPGGTATTQVTSEAESVVDDENDDVEDARIELWDWQECALKMIMSTTSNRTIHWIHSTEGNVGKTKGLGAFMCQCFESHLPELDDFKFGLKVIKKKLNAPHGKFREWPVVIIDIPRSNEKLVKSPKLYTFMEEVNNLYAASDRQFITPPTMIVLANEPPVAKMMSPDRFQVQKVDDCAGKLYMKKDYKTHEVLKEFAQELRERNERERQKIKAAKMRADAQSSSFDIKVEFANLFPLGDQRNGQNKRKSASVSEMYNKCQRVFADKNPFASPKQLETFIDETYDHTSVAECGGPHNPQPPVGKICKVTPKNLTKYIGFTV
tara:strand:- start:684 stop:2177 length:1494 start_codon:yes stop_codon:yes gene_type:complete